MPIQRITSFKIPTDADIPTILDAYKTLAKTQQKDGKPYILESRAYATVDDARRQGYKVTALSKFASLEDVKYYDEQCEAHKVLKETIMPRIELPPLTLLLEVDA